MYEQCKTESKPKGTSSGNIHLTVSVHNFSGTNTLENSTSLLQRKLNFVLGMVLIMLPF
jgi:hypothetical protein